MPVTITGTVKMDASLGAGLVEPHPDPLKVNVSAFKYDMGGAQGVFDGAVAQSVTDDASNYFYLDKDGALQKNTTGYPAGQIHIPLARVVAANGDIQAIYDERILFSTELDRKTSLSKSTGETSTTQTTFQEKLTLELSSLPEGDYVIRWYCEIKHSNTTQNEYVEARVEIDDATQVGYDAWNLTTYKPFSGFTFAEDISGSKTCDLDFRVQGGGTAYIRRARFQFERLQ